MPGASERAGPALLWSRGAEGGAGAGNKLAGGPGGGRGGDAHGSFVSAAPEKISAKRRSCAVAVCDSSCSRWLFCRRVATSACSTTLSCFS